MKKLQNVRKDHEKRLTELNKLQLVDREKAELISRNQELVDQARLAVQTALANQVRMSCLQFNQFAVLSIKRVYNLNNALSRYTKPDIVPVRCRGWVASTNKYTTFLPPFSFESLGLFRCVLP